jgi:transglutaminase-like putative cysteine protease
VTVTTTRGGKTTRQTLPWSAGTYLVEGNMLDTWARMVASMGASIPSTAKVLGPLSGTVETMRLTRPGAATLTVAGRKRPCDIIRIGEGPSAIEMLVARDTRELIEMRVPAQKAAFRLANAAALKGLVSYDPGSRLFSIVNDPLPKPENLTYLKVKARIEVAGEKPTVASLQSPVQKFAGTARNGRIEGEFEIKPFRYDGKAAPSMTAMPPADQALARFLKPEPNVECDDPEIRDLAKQTTQGSATAWEAVQKIGRWIKENISYSITGSGARECLRSRKGDCGPHAWLTIALCRAAGIPARITGGVLYSSALGGSFGQHYWTRVWMGSDGWVPIDTTTGEVGTLSAGHITLWNLAGIASLDVKVLDFAPKLEPKAQSEAVARRQYRPGAGQTERWVFLEDGKEVATQTAECVAVSEEGGRAYSDWRFEFRMPSRSVVITGTLSLWCDASPRSLKFTADVGGAPQAGTYAVTPDAIEVDLKVGEMPVKRKVSVEPGTMLQMNNLLTGFSLALRSLDLKPGTTRTVSFFSASSLQTLDMTFTVAEKLQTASIGGKARECLVCDVEPIKNRFWMDPDTGELLRVEAADGKAAIERR